MPLPLSETIVAGASGHIADHNLLHDTANRIEGIALNALEYNVRPANSGATNRVNLGTAIAAAVAQARPLYIPAGNYTLTYDASNKFIPVGGKLHLIGAGREVTTLTCNPTVMTFTDLEMLQTTVAGDIHISDLTVQGPTAGSGNDAFDESSHFLRKYTQGDLTLERLQVKGNLGGTFNHSHVSDVTIRVTDCKMTGYASAGSAFESSFAQTKCIIFITGCEIHDIEILGTSGAPEPDNIGFYIHPHFEVHCTNSVFRNIPRFGIYMNSGSGGGTLESKGVFVDNCVFIDCRGIQCTKEGPNIFSNLRLHNSEIGFQSGSVSISNLVATGSSCVIGGAAGTATETYTLADVLIDLTEGTPSVLQLTSLTDCRYVLNNVRIRNTSATAQGTAILTPNTAGTANHEWTNVSVEGQWGNPVYLRNFAKATIKNLKVNATLISAGARQVYVTGTITELDLDGLHIAGSTTQKQLEMTSTITANKVIGKDWRFEGGGTPIDLTTAGQQRIERRRGVAPTAIASAATLNLYDTNEKCSHDTFRVSGTTTINTITPGPFIGRATLIATGAWSTSAAGNIKPRLVTARVVDRAYTFTYNPETAFWYEDDDQLGAGGGTGVGPLFFSGYYYATPATITTFLMVNDRMYATPFEVGENVTMDRIGVTVTTLGSAGSVTRLGIYSDDGNGRPGALLLDAGTVDTTTTGDKEATISQALTAGWYWLVADSQGAPTTAPTVRSSNSSLLPIGATTGTGISATVTAGYQQSTVTGAFPTPFVVGGTQANAPRVYVRAV